MLKNGSLNVGVRYLIEDFVVGDAVLKTDAKDSSELPLPEPLQAFDASKMQSPGLASVQNGEKDHDPEDHDLFFLQASFWASAYSLAAGAFSKQDDTW